MDIKSTTKSTKFYTYICRWLRKSIQETNRNTLQITRDELSNLMGIKWTTLHKVLNGSRKDGATRDYIIAVCSQLCLDEKETNEALNLYGFPVLVGNTFSDDEIESYFKRDDLLIQILYDIKNQRDSINDINNKLISNNLEELNIPGRKDVDKNKSNYQILKQENKLIVSSNYFDQYSSLETIYSIDTYKCESWMVIQNKDNNKKYKLEYRNNYDYSLWNIKDDVIEDVSVQKFNSPSESSEFKIYFSMLKSSNKISLRKLNEKINDTKNYQCRCSASFENNKVNFFSETFNYLLPELDEYFFVLYSDGKYEYVLSKNSMFLKYSLKKSKYLKEFKKFNPKIEFKTDNINDIKNLYLKYSSVNHDIGDYIVNNVVAQFESLKETVDKLISDIKNKNRYIRNAKDIFHENYEFNICNYMGLLEYMNFRCTNEEYLTYELINSEFNYKDIIINFDDVENAFELGMDNIDELYNAKLKYGNIINVAELL